MSIVPGRDIPAVPDEWVDAVNKAINDANHEDLCACDGWPEACASGYQSDRWDLGVSLTIAVGVLEPLIRDRVIAELQAPKKSVVTRQLKTAGHAQWAFDAKKVPGFKVGSNRNFMTDGVHVFHMAEFDDPAAMDSALDAYAKTLTGLGYDTMRGLFVGRVPVVEVRRRKASP